MLIKIKFLVKIFYFFNKIQKISILFIRKLYSQEEEEERDKDMKHEIKILICMRNNDSRKFSRIN